MRAARIGPNAITRVAEALRASEGDAAALALFGRAGLVAYLEQPPASMVPEADVARLHRLLRDALPGTTARKISIDAGRRTGDYLLAHRIPRAVQRVLRCVPPPLASRVLLAAIRRHAWTFAGSGAFSYAFSPDLTLRIAGSPICHRLRANEKVCHYFAATFEHLFKALVSSRTRVEESECEAEGAAACVFRVDY